MRRARPRDSIGSWPLIDRIAYLLCWAAGIGLCVAAGADLVLMLVKGMAYVRPSLLVQSPGGSPNQSASGGFLDPIEGTLLLTAIGIADRRAARGRGGGVAERVRASGVAGARGRVGRGDDRGDAERGARDLRAARVLTGVPGVPLPDLRGRVGVRALVFDRRGDHVAARDPADRRGHARGPRAGAGARARGLIRARQDEGDDDPQRAAAVGAEEHRRAA